jgi:hypothetical protein
LLRLAAKADNLLDNVADRNQLRRYAKARRLLTRVLRVARAAGDRGTLTVPLAPIEAAIIPLLILVGG